MSFDNIFKWDIVPLLQIIVKNLKAQNWKTEIDIDVIYDENDKISNTFFVDAKKKRHSIKIELLNEKKQIIISSISRNKFLFSSKYDLKHNKTFDSTDLKNASLYFDSILQELD